jgi:UDP-2-acetamido-3-amino-2,3-dideoxy-glucuronate N-acetyltransferase
VLQAAQRAMSPAASTTSLLDRRPRHHDGVFVHESAYVDEPCEIGSGTRVWHFTHLLAGTRIGRDCTIGQNVMIGPDVVVGDRCKIQNNVSIYRGVTLEDGVFCGPSCVFTNVANPRAELERKDEFRPTLVGRGATIGANATVVCGTTIGAYSFVAAGAVVTRDVPPHALVAGVPARRIGWVSYAGERLGPGLVCPRTGRRYRLADDESLEEIVDE